MSKLLNDHPSLSHNPLQNRYRATKTAIGWGLSLFCLGLILACGTPARPLAPLAPSQPLSAPTENILPTPTPRADSGWIEVRPGLERRTLQLLESGLVQPREVIEIVRLDPALFRFEVGYAPGRPQTINAWREQSGALLIMNGNFFTPEWLATGLIIADGQPYGQSYGAEAGMVAIRDGVPDVRSLAREPYQPAEPLSGALQAFPMLVVDGQAAVAPPAAGRTPDTARRSVIAEDRQGRIIVLATQRSTFSLYEMGRFLAESDLEIDIALNLDGGSSTGLIWEEIPGEPFVGIRPLTPLPAVLLVYAR